MTVQEQETEKDPDPGSPANDPLLKGTTYRPGRETSHRIRLQIPSRPEHLNPVRDFLYRLCRVQGFSAAAAFDVKLITGEALTNIMKHAYQGVVDAGPIFIDVLFFKTFIELRFRDYGARTVTPRDMGRDLSEYRQSGLGLFLIQGLSDYHYFDRSAGNGTLLVVKKRIG